MRSIYSADNWLFENYAQMEEELGGYDKQLQFTLAAHDYWIEFCWTKNKNWYQLILETLEI